MQQNTFSNRLLGTTVRLIWLAICLYFYVCFGSVSSDREDHGHFKTVTGDGPFMVFLGIAQDAGYPQAGCKKACCQAVCEKPMLQKMVSCIAVVDPLTANAWMVDATPDFKYQLFRL